MKSYNLEDAERAPERVTELHLHHCGLAQIPPVVFAMPRLQRLYISSNPLKKLPVEIRKLRQLRVLSLKDNQLLELPADIMALSQLEKLDISGNELRHLPESIGALQSLSVLLLNKNTLWELPKSIGHLPHLEQLEASQNLIKSIPATIKHLKQLRRLILSHNQIRTFPKALCQLSKLERLDLSFNSLSGLPDEVGQLENLEFLALEQANLKQLPVGIQRLRSLRQFILERNKLASLPDYIWTLPWLAVLKASYNKISDLPTALEKAHRLEELSLSNNQLSGIRSGLSKLRGLRRLDLAGNQLTGLPALPATLIELQLDDNPLQRFPAAVSQLPKLEILSMCNCQLSGLPASFRQLRSLRILNLNGNDMKYAIPDALFHLTEIKELRGVGRKGGRKKYFQFVALCNSRDIPGPLRQLLYKVKKAPATALEAYSTRHLLAALTTGYRDVAYDIRTYLLRKRSPAKEVDLRQKGERVLLLGETGFDPDQVQSTLEQHGLRLVTDRKEGADYFVLGRLLKLHDLPPVMDNQKVVSRKSFSRTLDKALGRRLAEDYKRSQIEKLRLMLLHREEKNRKLALQLLQSGGVPLPLLTDLFLAWKLRYQPRQTYEQLLLQNCSEEALRTIYDSLGLRGRMRSALIEENIERYTAGNELDGDRMRQFLLS